jgi:hypothetical protein
MLNKQNWGVNTLPRSVILYESRLDFSRMRATISSDKFDAFVDRAVKRTLVNLHSSVAHYYY